MDILPHPFALNIDKNASVKRTMSQDFYILHGVIYGLYIYIHTRSGGIASMFSAHKYVQPCPIGF